MKAPFTLSSFLLCLWLVTSAMTARAIEQSDFNFLTQYENTALVEDGLSFAGNAVSLSFSTLISLGFWYGVCLIPEFLPWLAQRFRLTSGETKEFKTLATSFCIQLAPMITSTEIALAGQVSPWPVEQAWWQLMRMAGIGLLVYGNYAKTGDMRVIQVAAFMYLSIQSSAKTLISTASTELLRKTDNMDISLVGYDFFQCVVLSLLNGLIAGSIIYEILSKRGVSHTRAVLALGVSASVTAAVSVTASTSLFNMRAGREAVAELGAAAIVAAVVRLRTLARAAEGARSRAGIMAKSVTVDAVVIGTGVGAVAGIVAGTITGIEAEAEAIALAVVLAAAGSIATAVTAGGIRELLILSNARWSMSGSSAISKVGYAMIPALAFVLINTLAGYIVYGQPIEESLSETARVQWKKFYALPDYFYTLFN